MRRGFLCVLAAVTVLLPACTQEDPPPPPPATTTTEVSASTTPTATPPARPVSRPTPASAVAFVRFFWATFNYANHNLDPAPFEAISGNDCLFCKSVTDVITSLKQEDKRLVGGEVTLSSVVVPPLDLKKGAVVTTVISQAPGQTVNDSGSTPTPGTRNMRSLISIDWSNGEWQARDVSNDRKTGTPW
jgi:hypothetical protein